MNARRYILTAALCFCWGVVCAQYNPAKTDAWLEANAPEMGGRVILMVWQNGRVVYSHAVNNMSRRQKFIGNMIARRQGATAGVDDYTGLTRQPVASCSKWFSAALVMTFIDEGKLKLTDTVGKFLPVLTKHGKGNITVSQCLAHLTGIKAPPIKENIREMRSVGSMEDAVEEIAEMPMEGEPGKVFHYSNTGLQLLGAIIEKISGKSFESVFAERIAGPADMKNTDFGSGKVPVPAGSAVSTPRDYLNFLVMILNKGVFNGKRVLSEKSVAQMQVNRRTADVTTAYAPGEAGDFGYGFGEWVMDDKAVTSPGLFGSFPWVDNNKKYAAFLMCYYIKNTGRHERYVALKGVVDEALAQH